MIKKCLSLVIVFMLILFSACIGKKDKQFKDNDFQYYVYKKALTEVNGDMEKAVDIADNF